VVKKHVSVAVDRTPDRPKTGPGKDFHHDAANALGTITATEETRDNARRAITYVHLHRPETVAASRDVLSALGLTERPRAATPPPAAPDPGPLSVPCPQCLEPVGHRCRSVNGIRVGKPHVSRVRRAQAVRASQNEVLTEECA